MQQTQNTDRQRREEKREINAKELFHLFRPPNGIQIEQKKKNGKMMLKHAYKSRLSNRDVFVLWAYVWMCVRV